MNMHVESPQAGYARAHRGNVAVTTDLHPRVYAVTAIAWVWLFAAFWLAFGGEAEGAFMLTVDMVFLAAFFGTPWLMKRTADSFNARRTPPRAPDASQGTLEEFLNGDFDTLTGPVSGWSALIQIAIVPFGLAFLMSCMAVIFAIIRAPYL
ncbi:MAG: hypothetical protein Q7T44_15495 [Parvibaculum sp.]|nr:hypothetical protein [Parvibaculum sp.]